MRVVVQKSSNAKCVIDNNTYSEIDSGLVLLVGFTFNDDEKVKRILGISQEGLRSLRSRTKPIE